MDELSIPSTFEKLIHIIKSTTIVFFFLALMTLKNGLERSIVLEINWLNATILLAKLYTSFTALRDLISSTVLILFGLPSIPLYCTINPKHYSNITPNTHFSRLRRILYFQKSSKFSLRYTIRSVACTNLVIISLL